MLNYNILKGAVLTILLTVTTHASFGQKLLLPDLYKIYNSDSLSLKEYCATNHFVLQEITEDNWMRAYDFRITEKISFTRSYPKDSSAGMVFYYFDEHDDYKELKNNIQKNGFRFQRDHIVRNNKFSQNHFFYRNATEEIDLVIDRKNGFMKGFALMLYKIPDFGPK